LLESRSPAGSSIRRCAQAGVDGSAAAAVAFAGDALADLGDHVVAELDQVPLVDSDRRVRVRRAHP
jgi:hypothetical protein